jgi:hypothetical protein
LPLIEKNVLSGIHKTGVVDIALRHDSLCRGDCGAETLSRDGACSE